MNVLLPDRLRVLWRAVDESRLTREELQREQDRLLQESQQLWSDALIVGGRENLMESLLSELGEYFKCDDLAELQRRCSGALAKLKTEWHEQVKPGDHPAIEQFY